MVRKGKSKRGAEQHNGQEGKIQNRKPKQLPMPSILQLAAIKGDSGLIKNFQLEEGGLYHSAVTVDLPDSTPTHMEVANNLQSVTHFEEDEQGIRHHTEVTIDPTDSAPNNMEAVEKIAAYKHLRSVTYFGDTILHILVTNKHNELASMVLKKERSLLKVRNKMQETPLHSAAKVGNKEFVVTLIRQTPNELVKEVLREKNRHGETALHEAAKHGHEGVASELMKLDSQVAHEVNNEGLSPLYIATVGGYIPLVFAMLQSDAYNLAHIPDSHGLCPVHVAARMGNIKLVLHFLLACVHSTRLVDHRGRNLFHIAAEENKVGVFTREFELQLNNPQVSEMVAGVFNATDYEGNTPLHIAAMMGHWSVMMGILEKISRREEAVQNKKDEESSMKTIRRIGGDMIYCKKE